MVCAMLYIVSKVLQGRKDLKHMLLEPCKAIKVENVVCEINDSLSDTEDVRVMENENSIILSNIMVGADSETKSDVKEEADVKIEMQDIKSYDPFCRNPLYAGATKGLNAELEALSRHFHPSVSLFANQIIQGNKFYTIFLQIYTSFAIIRHNIYAFLYFREIDRVYR